MRGISLGLLWFTIDPVSFMMIVIFLYISKRNNGYEKDNRHFIIAIFLLYGCSSKADRVTSYVAAINEEYIYCGDEQLRYEILEFYDGLELFAISQGTGFDLYRFRDSGRDGIELLGTFSEEDYLEYDPRSGVLITHYVGERDITCIVQIINHERPILIQTLETANGKYYKDVESSIPAYYGQKIMSEVEDGYIDTSSTFLPAGVEISEAEKEKNLNILDDCEILSYKRMKNIDLSAY